VVRRGLGRGHGRSVRINGRVVRQGESLTARYRVLVHDGDANAADVAGHYAAYIASLLR
jgi:hypothetical protein